MSQQKSLVLDGLGLVNAQVYGERVIGEDRHWEVVDHPKIQPAQELYLMSLFSTGREMVGTVPEVRARGSWDYTDLNTLLEDEGFDIRFKPFSDNEFGMVSIFKLLTQWLAEGDEAHVNYNDQFYPAFKLEYGVSFYDTAFGEEPLVVIETKSGHRICLLKAEPDAQPYSALQMFACVNIFRGLLASAELQKHEAGWGAVTIPKVDLDLQPDVSFLRNMRTVAESGRPVKIGQVLQQAKLQMNAVGLCAETATAMSMVLEACVAPVKTYVFEGPFYLWIEQAGKGCEDGPENMAPLPLLAAFLCPDVWSDPGELEQSASTDMGAEDWEKGF